MSIYIPGSLREGLRPLVDAWVTDRKIHAVALLEQADPYRQATLSREIQTPICRIMSCTRKGLYAGKPRFLTAFRPSDCSPAELELIAELRKRQEDGQHVGGQVAFCIYRLIAKLLDLDNPTVPGRFKRYQVAEEISMWMTGGDGHWADGVLSQVRHELNENFLRPYRKEKADEFGDLLD